MEHLQNAKPENDGKILCCVCDNSIVFKEYQKHLDEAHDVSTEVNQVKNDQDSSSSIVKVTYAQKSQNTIENLSPKIPCHICKIPVEYMKYSEHCMDKHGKNIVIKQTPNVSVVNKEPSDSDQESSNEVPISQITRGVMVCLYPDCDVQCHALNSIKVPLKDDERRRQWNKIINWKGPKKPGKICIKHFVVDEDYYFEKSKPDANGVRKKILKVHPSAVPQRQRKVNGKWVSAEDQWKELDSQLAHQNYQNLKYGSF